MQQQLLNTVEFQWKKYLTDKNKFKVNELKVDRFHWITLNFQTDNFKLIVKWQQ